MAASLSTSARRRWTLKAALLALTGTGSGAAVNAIAAELPTLAPTLETFDAVVVDLPAEVTISPGKTSTIIVRAERKVLDVIDIRQNNGTLTISSKGAFQTQQPILVELTTQSLKTLEALAAADVTIIGPFGPTLGLTARDSTGVSLQKMNLEALSIDQQGSADVTAQGQVKQLELTAEGASDFDGSALASIKAKVHVSGASDASVDAKSALSVVVEDAGSVYYSGSPSIEKKVSFSGTLEAR